MTIIRKIIGLEDYITLNKVLEWREGKERRIPKKRIPNKESFYSEPDCGVESPKKISMIARVNASEKAKLVEYIDNRTWHELHEGDNIEFEEGIDCIWIEILNFEYRRVEHGDKPWMASIGLICSACESAPQKIYTLTMTPTSNGYTDPTSPASYEKEGEVTITAYPDSGYFFKSWTIDGIEDASTDNPLTITMDNDYSIDAVFSDVYWEDMCEVYPNDWSGDTAYFGLDTDKKEGSYSFKGLDGAGKVIQKTESFADFPTLPIYDFYLKAWFKVVTDYSVDAPYIIAWIVIGNADNSIEIHPTFVSSGIKTEFYLKIKAGGTLSYTCGPFPILTWHRLALFNDHTSGAITRLYVDGVLCVSHINPLLAKPTYVKLVTQRGRSTMFRIDKIQVTKELED